MTPRRGMHFDHTGEGTDDDDLRIYEAEGWQVGYEVEMNGVGYADDRGNFPDTDPESDDEVASDDRRAVRRSGYRILTSQLEEPASDGGESSSEQHTDQSDEPPISKEDDNLCADSGIAVCTAGVSYPIRKEFEKIMNSASPPSLEEERIPHLPNNIDLDEEKVDAIRKAMSSFHLPSPPQWAGLDASRIGDLIIEKINSSGN
ncbi:hypothetical protein Q1695_002642 [Nippostrongylus brasiliensis]|nr:hypothetical protein Q1695_002642 [Nippostrongylus brasiliensis]